MTLIAAEIVGGQIRMGSDTEPTDPYGAPRKFLDQLLKIVLLHPGLCVAYAGNSGPALEAIRDLGVDPHTGFDLGHVCPSLKSAHMASGKSGDQLVLCSHELIEMADLRRHEEQGWSYPTDDRELLGVIFADEYATERLREEITDQLGWPFADTHNEMALVELADQIQAAMPTPRYDPAHGLLGALADARPDVVDGVRPAAHEPEGGRGVGRVGEAPDDR